MSQREKCNLSPRVEFVVKVLPTVACRVIVVSLLLVSFLHGWIRIKLTLLNVTCTSRARHLSNTFGLCLFTISLSLKFHAPSRMVQVYLFSLVKLIVINNCINSIINLFKIYKFEKIIVIEIFMNSDLEYIDDHNLICYFY